VFLFLVGDFNRKDVQHGVLQALEAHGVLKVYFVLLESSAAAALTD
jgi:hypothetical protein